MALSADRVTKSKGPLRRQEYKVAADAVGYAGGMACIDADGYLVPASATAGLSGVVGVLTAGFDNTGGADGDIKAVVEYGGAFLINVGAGITAADVGRDAYVTDDQTASDEAGAPARIRIGKILAFLDESTDKAWINVLHDAPDGIVLSQAAVFVSTETTSTGSAQNIAHGLGVIPSGILIVPTEHSTGLAGGYDVAEGTHTTTNVVVTVTTGQKFKVFAWA